MRKASKILFLVGGILSFVNAFAFLIVTVTFIIIGSPLLTQAFIDGLESGQIHSDIAGTPEEVARIIQMAFFFIGIGYLFPAIFAIVSGIVALKARKVKSRTIYILNIIFGFMGGVVVNSVGGIFALIDSYKMRPENK